MEVDVEMDWRGIGVVEGMGKMGVEMKVGDDNGDDDDDDDDNEDDDADVSLDNNEMDGVFEC